MSRMTQMSKTGVALAAAGALVALPIDVSIGRVMDVGAARAKTRLYHVSIGVNTGRAALIVNKFLPDRLTIHAGDSVQFTNNVGSVPQTVTFGPLETTPGLITAEGSTEINPRVVRPQGGRSVDDPSSRTYSSGALLAGVKGLPSSYTFAFPHAGTYVYRSLFHPLTIGEIDVVPANKAASSDAIDRGPSVIDGVRSIGQALANVQGSAVNGALGGVGPSTPTIFVGTGNENASVNEFTPAGITVKVGSTVTWQIKETSGDLHAIVFNPMPGPESNGQLRPYIGLARDGGLTISPAYQLASLGSESQVTTDTLKTIPSSRWTSGLLYGSSSSYPSVTPSSYVLIFLVPGTYYYADPFHQYMQGLVNVIP